MRKSTKIGIGAVAAVSIAALSAFGVSSRNNDGVGVRVEAVSARDLVATVTASGWIRPHRRVDVQSDIIGRVIELNVKEGEAVRRGQVLLRIDPTQYEAAAARAQAGVQEALARQSQTRAHLLQAERAFERLRQLAESDADLVSRQQLEEAETQMRVQRELLTAAGYGAAQARSALDEARDRLSKTVIRAPMDGVVTRLNVEEGSTAIVGTTNNPGSILLTVADLSTMEAVVRVDETDLPELEVGDSATLSIDAFPRRKFTGRVAEIGFSSVRSPLQSGAPTTQGQAIDYEVVITVDEPPPALRSDLSVSADIVTGQRPQALSIPIIALTVRERKPVEALDNEDPDVAAAGEAMAEAAGTADHSAPEDKDEEGVFVVRDGRAHFVPVTVGIAGREHFEVVSGVTEQDTVVAGPYEVIRSLEDGRAVRALNAPSAKPAKAKADATTTGS